MPDYISVTEAFEFLSKSHKPGLVSLNTGSVISRGETQMTQITLNERHVYRYWVARSPEDGHLFVSNSFKVDPDTSAGGNAVVANAYELSEENRMLKLEIENIRLKTKLDKLRGQSEPLDTLYKHKGQVIVEDIQEDGQHKHRLTFTVEGDNRIRIAHALTDIIGLYQSDLTNVMTSDVK